MVVVWTNITVKVMGKVIFWILFRVVTTVFAEVLVVGGKTTRKMKEGFTVSGLSC